MLFWGSYKRNFYPFILLFLLILLGKSQNVFGGGLRDAYTEVELVSEVQSIKPGEPFWIALRMKMDEGWHVYWRNPGDSGFAPAIKWNLPEGFSIGEVQWPFPERIDIDPLTSYGYEGEILLLSKVIPPRNLHLNEPVNFRAKVEWLACELICIGGKADLSLKLPTANVSENFNPYWHNAFQIARKNLPQDQSLWNIAASKNNQEFVISISAKDKDYYELGKVEFFPFRDDLIIHPAEQKLRKIKDGYALYIERSSLIDSEDNVNVLTGILISSNGWNGNSTNRALNIDLPFQNPNERKGLPNQNPAQGTSSLQMKDAAAEHSVTLLLAIGLAFIGGILLNFMPCVLPVISLKILGVIQQGKHDKKKAWNHAMIFTFGILVSLWILSGLLILFRWSGHKIGWGFQFQSSGFLIFLIVLFSLLSLNLFGLFEIQGSALSRILFLQKFTKKSESLNSFLNGFLVTIVATPCTAPFMGTAMGYALTQPIQDSFPVFTSLGLGIAFPFLLFAKNPALMRWLPKPGAWMVQLKKVFGIFLLATVAWLLWVFSIQKGPLVTLLLMSGLGCLAAGLWVWSRNLNQQSYRAISIALWVCAAVLLVSPVFIKGSQQPKERTSKTAYGIKWIPYSANFIRELKIQKKPYFIDFTAAWCLTCQVNDKVAFSDPKVIRKFREKKIVPVKADWTKRDEEIAQALAEFGKESIPFYVLFTNNPDNPIIFLPELITPGIVLDSLEKVKED